MSADQEILRTLAETMDALETARQLGIGKQDIKAALLRAAKATPERPKARKSKSSPQTIVAYTDGACRGNPGPSGAGFVLFQDDKMLETQGKYLGKMTNNQAEYQALIIALERALELGASEVLLRADSELMVRQINGQYRVKNPGLKMPYARAKELASKFKKFKIEHVTRDKNSRADEMANRAIDEFEKD